MNIFSDHNLIPLTDNWKVEIVNFSNVTQDADFRTLSVQFLFFSLKLLILYEKLFPDNQNLFFDLIWSPEISSESFQWRN